MKFVNMTLLFAIITCTQSNAQVVTLPEKTAKFYLERHIRAKTLDDQIVLKNRMISNLEGQLLLKDSVINTYRFDKSKYELLISTKDSQQKILEEDVKRMKKEAKKQKFQKKLIIFIGVGLLTLSAVYD